MISERTRAALAVAKARGTVPGGFRGRAGTFTDLAKARATRTAKADNGLSIWRRRSNNFVQTAFSHCEASRRVSMHRALPHLMAETGRLHKLDRCSGGSQRLISVPRETDDLCSKKHT